MKITPHILSIPPYISTSWKHVASLQLESSDGELSDLVITLTNEKTVVIPQLELKTVEHIFKTHALHLEQEPTKAVEKAFPPLALPPASISFGIPIKGRETDPFNSLGIMQHNPDQASFPPLPEEMLSKIQSVGKMVGLDKQLDHIPKAEPHCNCPYCQVARAIHGQPTSSEKPSEQEEVISDADLSFKEWDLKEIDKHLYEVSNPLDQNERFQVFLGTPIGCTCGCKNCEHIKAVLSS